MKGASADPWAKASKAPSNNITTTMGNSQSFLFWRRNSQNSRSRVIKIASRIAPGTAGDVREEPSKMRISCAGGSEDPRLTA